MNKEQIKKIKKREYRVQNKSDRYITEKIV